MTSFWRARASGRSSSLFVRARNDPRLFEQVYLEYHDQVLRFLVRRTRNPEVAFDLMAETFAELFAGLAGFRGETEDQGRKWMWTVATHQLYRWRERGQVERRNLERLGIRNATLEPSEYDRIEELADLDRYRPLLDRALAELSDDARLVLRQRVVDHRDYDDLAREWGISPGAVRTRVSRALSQVAGELDAIDDAMRDALDPASEELLT